MDASVHKLQRKISMSQDPWHAPPYWSSKTEQNTHTFPRGDAVFKWGGLLILEARAGDTRALIADLIIAKQPRFYFRSKKTCKRQTNSTAYSIKAIKSSSSSFES
jgi:hypothetical protein